MQTRYALNAAVQLARNPIPTKYYEPEEIALHFAARAKLRLVVQEWWLENGWGMPPLPAEVEAPAILARQLATFRYEDAAFVLLAERAGLTPVWLSYNGDKFYTGSNLKRSYLHPVYSTGAGRNGGLRTFKRKLADPKACTGMRFTEISTICGLGLPEYHNAHQDRVYPGAIRADNTAWVKNIGTAKQYYRAYLSLFLAHSVLFEDYHGGESGSELDGFTEQVFQPAYEELYSLFGLNPLIVKMSWRDEMKYYPADANWRNHGVNLV